MNGQGGTIISNYVSSLPTIPVLQKHNKFDYGSNYFFYTRKEPFIEWMAATGIAN